MPLVPLPQLLEHATMHQYGIGYFEAWDSYSLEAVAEAAEAENSPVILGFGCVMADDAWLDAGGIARLGGWGRSVAEQLTTPTAFLLNEASTYEQAIQGMDAGFNAVMVDTSSWETTKAIETVAKLVEVAHAQGVAVEAELGRLPDAIPGGGIDESAARLTDPDDAAQFVRVTGIDCLGVSIGNIHILEHGTATVDLSLLKRIYEKTQVPLVIHGGTSYPQDAVADSILYGAVKFNVGTVLKREFLTGVRKTIATWGDSVDVHAVLGSHKGNDMLADGKLRMKTKVRELMQLYGSSGRAS